MVSTHSLLRIIGSLLDLTFDQRSPGVGWDGELGTRPLFQERAESLRNLEGLTPLHQLRLSQSGSDKVAGMAERF